MKKFLVLGASGYLGSRLFSDIEGCFGTYHHTGINNSENFFQLDASNTENLELVIKRLKPEVVINCIGFTEVDQCEIFPEKSFLLNTILPCEVAKICKRFSVKYVHFSTDHYLNRSENKLGELEEIETINQYSESKHLAERMVWKANEQSIIIRANFFHFNFKLPRTFLDNLIVKIKAGTMVQSFKDVYFTPISTTLLIEYMLKLINSDYCGKINIASNEVINKYEFHELILRQLGLDNKLHKSISVSNKSLVASRPRFMALDNSKLIEILGINPPTLYDMINAEICKSGNVQES